MSDALQQVQFCTYQSRALGLEIWKSRALGLKIWKSLGIVATEVPKQSSGGSWGESMYTSTYLLTYTYIYMYT